MKLNLRKLISLNVEGTPLSSTEINKRRTTKVLASLAVVLTACTNLITTKIPTVNPSITSSPDGNNTNALEIKLTIAQHKQRLYKL